MVHNGLRLVVPTVGEFPSFAHAHAFVTQIVEPSRLTGWVVPLQPLPKKKRLYGLSGAWINVAERRRLDGFQSRCLRKIVRIPPAYVSRISNQEVLEVAKQKPYTKQLLLQQLKLFGKVARATDTDPLRALTFSPGSFCPAGDLFVRKVGRPRNEWAGQLQSVALEVAGQDPMALFNLIRVPAAWEAAANKFLS